MSLLGVDELEFESYEYFHKNIRKFPTHRNGSINYKKAKLWDNDVDAFRHAYVSGVFTQRYGKRTAEMLGWVNEFFNFGQSDAQENMDFWNNYVGISYGKRCKSKTKLADMLKKALKNGELITDLSDKRELKNYKEKKPDNMKCVVVLEENKTGRNEIFCDLTNGQVMTRASFVRLIDRGLYPGYRIALINGVKTPVSIPDGSSFNNLG